MENRTLLSRWVRQCAVLAGLAASFSALAGNQYASPQGDTWDSIKKLPNWSGVWVLNLGTEMSPFGSLTPAYQKLREDTIAAARQPNLAKCLPAGTPGILQHGVLHEYLFTPGRVTVLIEDGEVRRIYTDGRPHRQISDLAGSYEGDSIGHWEGSTLVVDTVGFPKGTLWKDPGVEATPNSHLVERIFKNEQGQIDIDSVLTDPAIFSEPYVYTRHYDHSPLPLREPICAGNNRDTGDTLDLTPPPADE